jgi:hypothetical protein
MEKTKRNEEIFEKIDEGLKYSEVARIFNLNQVTVRTIHKRMKKRKEKNPNFYGLDNIAFKLLEKNYISTKSEAIQKIQDGLIYPYCDYGYGEKSHEKLCQFLGIKVSKGSKKIAMCISFLNKSGYEVKLN